MTALLATRRCHEMLQYLSIPQRTKVFVALGCAGALDCEYLDEVALRHVLSVWTPETTELTLH